MKIERLFSALVVGGALMAGCAGTQPTPDPAATSTEAEEKTEPDAETPRAEEPTSEPADDGAEEEAPTDGADGTCAWF